MDNKYLLEQNKDPAKVTFEKEVKLIEFTEKIDNMDSNLNYDQKKRDIFLFKHGRKLFKRFKLRKTKKRNIYFKLEPRILTQAEIDELLTAVEIYPFPKVIISMIILAFKGIIIKIKYGYKHICEWKLVININNVVYKIGLDEIKKIDYNIPPKRLNKTRPILTQAEIDELRREVLSEEEINLLLRPLKKKREGKKMGDETDEEMVTQNGLSLKCILKASRTEGVCLAAVMQNGLALKYVPKALRSEALCLDAARRNGRALKYVPKSIKTEAFCVAAVGQSILMDIVPIIHIEAGVRSEKLGIVEYKGIELKDVPKAMRTEAVCLAAVKEKGWALENVPKKLRTETVCLAAVMQYGLALQYVPKALRTEAMCFAAVKSDGVALVYVPEALRTETLCFEAVKKQGWALLHIPEALRTTAFYLAAVRQNEKALEYVPEELREEVRRRINNGE